MGAPITTNFTGGTSGDAAIFSNWTNGLPRGTSDKVVLSVTTTQAITSNFGSIPAEDTLTITAEPLLNETLVIDSTTYKFVDTLAAAFDVKRVGTANGTLGNLIKAINLSGVSGTDYDSATTQHGTVYATDEAGDTMDAIARTAGTAGNSIVTTEGLTAGSWSGSGTMSLGAATGLHIALLFIAKGHAKDTMTSGTHAELISTRIFNRGSGTLFLRPTADSLISRIVIDSPNLLNAMVISGITKFLGPTSPTVEIISGHLTYNPESSAARMVNVLLVTSRASLKVTGNFGTTGIVTSLQMTSGLVETTVQTGSIYMNGGNYRFTAGDDAFNVAFVFGGLFESDQGGAVLHAIGGVSDFTSATKAITVATIVRWPEAVLLTNEDFSTITDERVVGE